MRHPLYRRPRVHMSPFSYCDRWCERCDVDKSRCAVYQQEFDSALTHLAEGRDPSDPDVMIEDVRKSFDASLAMLREKAAELGIEMEPEEEEGRELAPREPDPPDPIVESADALRRSLGELLARRSRDLQPVAKDAAATIGWHHTIVPVKLHTATTAPDVEELDDEGRELERAHCILSAQVAHRSLAAILNSLGEISRARADLRDSLLDLQAGCQRIMAQIERRWLVEPNALLEPVGDGSLWGPLESGSADERIGG